MSHKIRTVTWQLRVLMAKRNIRSSAALSRLLEEKVGYKINASHLTRYMKDEPPLLSLELLNALIAAIPAHITELLVEEEVLPTKAAEPTLPDSGSKNEQVKPKRRGKMLPATALPTPKQDVKMGSETGNTLNPGAPNPLLSVKGLLGPKAELFPDIYEEDDEP